MQTYKFMIRKIKNIMLLLIGCFFVVFGIISLVLPVFPGFVLLFIGLTICARASVRVKNSKLMIDSLSFVNGKINEIKDRINWKKINRLF